MNRQNLETFTKQNKTEPRAWPARPETPLAASGLVVFGKAEDPRCQKALLRIEPQLLQAFWASNERSAPPLTNGDAVAFRGADLSTKA